MRDVSLGIDHALSAAHESLFEIGHDGGVAQVDDDPDTSQHHGLEPEAGAHRAEEFFSSENMKEDGAAQMRAQEQSADNGSSGDSKQYGCRDLAEPDEEHPARH